MRKRYFILLCVAAFLSGCTTILEDRSQCPCWYSLNFTRVNPEIKRLHVWFFDDVGTLLGRDTLYASDYGKTYDMELGRGTVHCYIWGNISTGTTLCDPLTRDAFLLKQELLSADSLFYYRKDLNTAMETRCDTVVMNKEYATIHFILKKPFVEDDRMYLELRCNTAGQYIDGRCIENASKTRTASVMDREGNNLFRFRILRQKSMQEIQLTLFTTYDLKTVAIADFPLGDWLIRSGYDMAARNLSDITVELDVGMGFVTVQAEDWQLTVPVQIEI